MDFAVMGEIVQIFAMNAKSEGLHMSVVTEFAEWYARLQGSVTKALNGPLTDGLKHEIHEKAETNVYKAHDTGKARGIIGAAENLAADVNGMELHIRNVTVQQGGPAFQTETGFVEEGAPEFRQPFPRPFMDEALVDYAYGRAPEDLADALRSDGFTVV